MRPVFYCCLLILGAAAPASGQSQVLNDPMRPPAFDPADAVPGSVTGPRLQSTLLSAGRRLAIIDGHTVALGGKVGDSTLVEVSPTRVVLRRGVETETLSLLPSAEKRPRQPPRASASSEGKGK